MLGNNEFEITDVSVAEFLTHLASVSPKIVVYKIRASIDEKNDKQITTREFPREFAAAAPLSGAGAGAKPEAGPETTAENITRTKQIAVCKKIEETINDQIRKLSAYAVLKTALLLRVTEFINLSKEKKRNGQAVPR
ncbi:hypothetical protein OWV82_017628 [Melia azedarach]|uniref:Uncharacterized protein n=1 Tax=Melia azedarach TaxID=155640 RepID=A0ACC1XLR9_MELAZ|nr:hypothetical protein OWV82_017628 [Melia azedarach]